jgi:hypothetical protein
VSGPSALTDVDIGIGSSVARSLGGPRNPVAGTPVMEPGSIRRTTTIDITSPDGWDEPQRVDARARDVTIDAAGRLVPIAEVSIEVRLDRKSGLVRNLRSSTNAPGLDRLVGKSFFDGFRRELGTQLPGEVEECTLLHALLDDIPSALQVATYAMLHATNAIERHLTLQVVESRRDVCAGYGAGASIAETARRHGYAPWPSGPLAPALESVSGDWHAYAPLPAMAMRRRRRIDLLPAREGSVSRVVQTLFRDSHNDVNSVETVLHEYSVELTFDSQSHVIGQVRAMPHVLPWRECPTVAATPAKVVGTSVHELRRAVRGLLSGVSTCTHLNDTLRSLNDVTALLKVGSGGA